MITNLERIQQMNSDELAELIDTICDCCIYENCRFGANCEEGIKQWLEQESEE